MRTPSGETGQQPTPTANTKLLWACDEGTGNTVHDIINGRNVTDALGAQWRSGNIGKAVDTGHVSRGFYGGLAAGTDSAFCVGFWTVEAWIRPMAVGGSGGTIVDYSNSGALGPPFQRALGVSINTSPASADYLKVSAAWFDALGNPVTFQSTSAVRAGVWSHIVLEKYDRGGGAVGVRIHINGVLDATSGALSNTPGAALGRWRLGVGYSSFFGGQISCVHITADTLTTEMIRDNWRRGMGWQTDAQTGHGNTYLDVQVSNPSGVVTVNLNDIGMGTSGLAWDFVHSVSITESVDNQAATAELALKRNIYEWNLSPTMNESPFNRSPMANPLQPGPNSQIYDDLLVPGSTIDIFARRVPNQYNDQYQIALTQGTLIFEGKVDSVDWSSDIIRVECIDQGSTLIDTYIEDEIDYNAGGSSSVEAGMQNIINNNLSGPPTLYTPVIPGWTIGEWTQRRESIMQALQSLADQIGWLVKYRWDPVTSDYRLTLHDPLRAQTRFDGIITPNDYSEISAISQALTNVRNAIRVTFADAANQIGINQDGSPQLAIGSYIATDAASITAHGRRFMEVAESATSNIDTLAEATNMANALLADLKNPDTNMDLDLPYWEIEIGDRLLFEANGTTFDQQRTFCVISKSIALAEGQAACSLQLKEAPASGLQKHIVKEAGPGRSLPPVLDPAKAGVDFGRRGFFAPIQGLMEAANLLQGSPSLANIANAAMITHPAPTSDAPTGWTVSGNWGSAADAYWSSTTQTANRSLALRTVGVEATSWWMPVNGGQSYQALVTWQAPDMADKLDFNVDFYDINRAATISYAIFSKTPAAINTWQTDGGIIPAGSADRWARIRVQKKAGPPILIDRVEVSLMSQAASVFANAALAFAAGTNQCTWNTEEYDYGAFYNPATGRFTADRPGHYQFDVNVVATSTISGTLAMIFVEMKKNGSTVWADSYTPSSPVTNGEKFFHSPPTLLDRGDYITFDYTFAAAVSVIATSAVGRRVNITER